MNDIITCDACGQKNRVPPIAVGKIAICGACKTPLDLDSDIDDDLDDGGDEVDDDR